MIDKKELEIKALEKQIDANPESPLFAKLASLYLERGKAQKALEVCDEGLAHHPFYTTAHLVKGKALLTLEMISEARRELELVHGYQPLVESVKNLLTEIGPSPDELKTEKRTSVPAQPQSVVSDSAPKAVKTKPPVARVAPEPAKPEQEEKKPISEPVPAPPPIETPDPAAGTVPPVIVKKPPVVQTEPERVKPEPDEIQPESELVPESPPISEPEPVPEEVASPTIEPEPVNPDAEEPPPVREEDVELEKQAIEELESEGAFGELHTDEPVRIAESNELTPEEDTALAQVEASNQGTPEVAGDHIAGADDPFGIGGGDSEAAVPEVKTNIDDPVRSFGEFSARMLEELGGTEHTLTLDEYLASPEIEAVAEPEMKASEPQEPLTKEIETKKPEASETKIEKPESRQPEKEAPAQRSEIEDIAEKLKSAKKITPVINLADKSASDTEEPRGATGFVTPTLAEIYAKQGWYDDAIRAYRQLSVSKPSEKEKYMKRIEELEAEKKRSG